MLPLAEFEGMAEGSQPGEHVRTQNLLDLEDGKTRKYLVKMRESLSAGTHQRQSQLVSKTQHIFMLSVFGRREHNGKHVYLLPLSKYCHGNK